MTLYRSLRVAALACTAPLAIAAGTPQMTVEPADGLVDQPLRVRIVGAEPGAKVSITAELDDEQAPAQHWTAVGAYRADAKGRVDSARSASTGGSYDGILAGGLSCSALPVPRAELPAYLEQLGRTGGRTTPLLDQRDSFAVTVSATVDGRPIGRQTIVRRYAAAGVRTTEVAEGRVNGHYFEPARATGIPVVVIGGSGGGVPRAQAALLASRGHPALALAYFNYKGLKPALVEIPIETFDDGARWLANKRGAKRVALIGTSRGSEAVQLTAAHFPEQVAGIVAYVPAPLIHGGFGPGVGAGQSAWTLGGRDIEFVRFPEADGRPATETRAIAGKAPPGYAGSPVFMSQWANPAAYERSATPLDRIAVPMLLLGGEADAMWPSAFGAEKIRERLTALGKGKLVEVHNYPHAGHSLSRVGIANAMSSSSVHPVSKLWSTTGGEAEANCAASYDAWARVLDFLARLDRGR
jgi:pimeloyl-ACP methyl ester carboxylesterase